MSGTRFVGVLLHVSTRASTTGENNSFNFDKVYLTPYFFLNPLQGSVKVPQLLAASDKKDGKVPGNKKQKLSSHEIGLTGIGLVLVTVHVVILSL